MTHSDCFNLKPVQNFHNLTISLPIWLEEKKKAYKQLGITRKVGAQWQERWWFSQYQEDRRTAYADTAQSNTKPTSINNGERKGRVFQRMDLTLAVSRVLVRTRTTSSWWATSFTCFGRLQKRRGKSKIREEVEEEIPRRRMRNEYYFSTHGWELRTIGAIDELQSSLFWLSKPLIKP